jgi:hypothetical protein
VFTLFVEILNLIPFSSPAETLAYIDPSTGGMLFQILAVIFATFSGVVFFFSRQIKAGFARLRRKVRGQKAGDENPDNPSDQP